MRLNRLTFAAAFAAALAVVNPAAGGEPKAVVELFTSQGCSSCPPADRLLGNLAHDPAVIALSLPVDYWDYLGWQDTLALKGHGKRQRAYSIARGDGAVYTPQAVVNGVAHALGSDKAAIEDAVIKSRAGKQALTLAVKASIEDGKIVVNVPGMDGEPLIADVWLCPVTDKIEVTIQRGENRGQSLNYYNVVRRWVKLGTWSGKAETFTIPMADIPNANFTLSDINHFVVLVQNSTNGKPALMVGAATVAMK
ncbi:DUF1223 domain-containing protein [Undibacter mobilis]|uniref:DUF1223 domain-containing protein n=1 Tax=Undibacter mobilis TaxID=2292256 RepID=A0A371BA00_9BRAD|nr:DUF1223 domain-containing protein [Undibacter mobilis]RDV04233.1 DUF1223 domain-containing protein [Undibacter mobilis]